MAALALPRPSGSALERYRRAGVASAAVFIVAGSIASVGFTRVNGSLQGEDPSWVGVALFVGFLSLPLVGAFLLWSVPGQPVARLLVAVGVLTVASQLADGWAFYDLRVQPGALFGGTAAAWLATWLVVPGLGLGPFVVAVFPSGRIRTRWLRALTVCGALGLALATVAQAMAPDTLDGRPHGVAPISNPLGVVAFAGAARILTNVGVVTLLTFFGAAIVDLLIRFRRSAGDERQQLRWIAAAAVVLPLAVIVSLFVGVLGAHRGARMILTFGQVGIMFGMSGAIAIAVTRYRLYEIDRLVSRSVSYFVLTALIALPYALVVTGASRLFENSNNLVVAVTTLAAAAAFNPLRRPIQRRVDRRFNRPRYDAARTVEAFKAQLRDDVDVDSVHARLIAVVLQTVQPTSASLWLRR